MDRSACIARRTRRQTDTFLQNIAKRSKLSEDSGAKSRSSSGLKCNESDSNSNLLIIDSDEEVEKTAAAASVISSGSESSKIKAADLKEVGAFNSDDQSSDGFNRFDKDDEYESLNRVKYSIVDDEDSDLLKESTHPESDSDSVEFVPVNISSNSNDYEIEDEDVEILEEKVEFKSEKDGKFDQFGKSGGVEEDEIESVGSEEEEKEEEIVRVKKKRGRKKKARVLDIARLLSDSILNKSGRVLMEDIAPKIASEPLPKIFSLGNSVPVVHKKSSFEEENDILWEEMDLCIRSGEIGSGSSSVNYSAVNEDEKNELEDGACSAGNHLNLILDLETGLRCTVCGLVETEIKHVSPPMEKHCNSSGRDTWCGPKDDFSMEEYFNSESGRQNLRRSYNVIEETVWDMIPGVRETLYPHQRDGFEFMWENLAGTFELSKLGSSDVKDRIGGCIISHAPGTGKTRLTMVFLQTYMRRFPDCRPVIVAPKGILLTWKEEFKKWNIDIPFHDMNDTDLMEEGRKVADHFGKREWSIKEIRYLKLLLWNSKPSILGISYNLYERLAGDKTAVEEGKKKKKGSVVTKKCEAKGSEEMEKIRKILLECPDLLVLDEGHTPRNHNSGNWQVLSKVKTEKRIILSGTPFQNNLTELYNTLRLVRPSISMKILPRLRKFCQRKLVPMRSTDGEDFMPEEKQIKELKAMIRPFVHVQTDEILTRELNGIRDCVLFLNPPALQKEVLKMIDSQNTFMFEHKLYSASLHPSLLIESSSLTDKEKSAIDTILPKGRTAAYKERLRNNPNEGAKTRFLLDFILLAETLGERVLIFSQYIDPLEFIVEQLKTHLYWSEGKQVLYMDGKLNQNQRQSLIKTFNDPKTEAKVMLASTKACSEGIHLVGASRVILLDIVWNPAVEKQAISRAYRLGQKKVVHIYRLMIDGTSESDKYYKQFTKGRMSETLFPSGKGVKETSGVAFDDKILDEMIDHVKLKDLFAKIVYQPKESDFGGLL